LSASYQHAAAPILVRNFEWLQQNNYWICVNNTAWEHHFLADNFVLLNAVSKEEFAAKLICDPFVKIAKKIPLNEWESVTSFMEHSFAELITCSLLSTQAMK
jgi:hypothetical protein